MNSYMQPLAAAHRHPFTVDALILKGTITEITGRACSGRTSLLTACMREVTRHGGMAALVDRDDVFDPASATRAGVDLAHLLWVRGRGRDDLALRAADLLVRCPGFALVGLDLGEAPPALPAARAFRLKFAVERSGVALVILGSRRVAGPGASLGVQAVRRRLEWGTVGVAPDRPARLARIASEIRVVRSRGAARALSPGDATEFEWTA